MTPYFGAGSFCFQHPSEVYNKGNELKRVIYDSFGNLFVDTDKKFDTCVGFAAGLEDKDTRLVHFGYREYDPAIGRFITPDPIGFAKYRTKKGGATIRTALSRKPNSTSSI
ncbi:MAG: hypothetical protein BA863_18900 [Desulfovibrio sp. S3730MH75]|nr:MAG: hypothetical protein BA863_18900 [Desulfovibrio sp. S3730MH75]